MRIKEILTIKSPHVKKYLANTSWFMVDFVFRQMLNLFIGVMVSRYLTPAGFGELSYSTLYLQLFQPIAHMGISAIVIRELVKNKDRKNEILGTAFTFKTIGSILTTTLIIGIVLFVDIPDQRMWNVIIASLSIMVSPLQIIDYFFQSEVKAKYIAYSQQISGILASSLRLLGVMFKLDVQWFVWMIVLEALVTVCILLVFYKKYHGHINQWVYSKDIAKLFRKELLPFVFSGFFIILYMKIDQLMISEILGSKALGIYSAAVKLCEPFYVIASLVCSALFPAIVNGLQISRAEYLHRLQRLFNILTWLAISGSIVVFFLSDFIIVTLYGSAYSDSAPVLSVYFFASVFVFQGVVAGQAYAADGKQAYNTVNTFMGALANILLNLWLIPLLGVAGAAFATLISYLLSAVLMNLFFGSTRYIFKQQMYAYIAIIIKPKSFLTSLYASKSDSN